MKIVKAVVLAPTTYLIVFVLGLAWLAFYPGASVFGVALGLIAVAASGLGVFFGRRHGATSNSRQSGASQLWPLLAISLGAVVGIPAVLTVGPLGILVGAAITLVSAVVISSWRRINVRDSDRTRWTTIAIITTLNAVTLIIIDLVRSR